MHDPDALNNSADSASQSGDMASPLSAECARRFGGIAGLYGQSGLEKILKAHVCVIGIGGVGSWVVESLVRSALGQITMVDMDIVSVSNTNRQIHTTTDTVGRNKVDVMKERILLINPECKVNTIDDFIARDNMRSMLSPGYDFVVDCIDDFRTKAALVNYCKKAKIRVLSVGGAGGQKDPGKVKLSDLSRTQHDVLLAKTRKMLRQDYGFNRNLKRRFGVPCVYSEEQLVYPDGVGGLSPQRPDVADSDLGTLDRQSKDRQQIDQLKSNALNCAGGLGSITHVTATFGFHACAHILDVIRDAS